MRGRGTHPRVTPDGWTISRRVVISKVRHLAPPIASACPKGRARRAAASVVAPAFINVLLSMAPPADSSTTMLAESYRRGSQSQIGCFDDGCRVHWLARYQKSS